MGLQQTAFDPVPHKHQAKDIVGLEKQLYGAEGKTVSPYCEAVFNGSFYLSNNSNVSMGGGWTAVADNASMFYAAGAGSGQGDTTKARIKIPVTGYYQVEFQYYVDQIGTTPAQASILRNGTNMTNNMIAGTMGASNGWSGPHASVTTLFYASDFLYFYAYQASGSSRPVYGTWFGGARSKFTARYVGPANV